MTAPGTPKSQFVRNHLWYPEMIGGHQPFCAHPGGHPPSDWCRACNCDPPTMEGKPSEAWHKDHPVHRYELTVLFQVEATSEDEAYRKLYTMLDGKGSILDDIERVPDDWI